MPAQESITAGPSVSPGADTVRMPSVPLAALLEAATARATRRAYESDFRHFAGWAAAHGLAALPAAPHTVALYVTAHQDLLRPSSLVRRLAAVAARHRGAGHDSPAGHELVRRAVAGLRRSRGTRPAAKAGLVTAQGGHVRRDDLPGLTIYGHLPNHDEIRRAERAAGASATQADAALTVKARRRSRAVIAMACTTQPMRPKANRASSTQTHCVRSPQRSPGQDGGADGRRPDRPDGPASPNARRAPA